MNKYVVILIVLGMTSKLLAAASLSSLESLVAQSNYQQAWQQAQQLVNDNEGEPRFDYLYGLSALETGHYDQAVFALDRVTVNQPNAIRPRLELARAYLKVNNDAAAHREFQEVLRLNPPATVRNNVNRYIQALAQKSKDSRQWVLSGLVSLAGGYDTNANFGAGSPVFETPVFGTVFLRDESVEQDSPFSELRGQLNYRYITSDTQSWFVNSRVGHKHFSDASSFDLSEFSVQGGNILTVGKQQYQFSLSHQALQLDSASFSRTLGLEAAVARELANDKVISAALAVEDYDHQQQDLRDAKRYEFSGHYRFRTGTTRHQFGVVLGLEDPDQPAGKHHGRNLAGVSYLARHAWDAAHVSFFNIQWQQRKHRGDDPIYAKKRSDQRLLLKVGHSLRLGKKLSAFADAGYIHNSSNLDIYEADKAFVRTGINYHF